MTIYPNLELLEYKVKQLLLADKEFVATLKSGKVPYIEFDVQMFPQVWGSTCTGFDITPDGSPAIGGSAMTKEYTTIFYEKATSTHIVCFGNRPCYKVTNPSEDFINDVEYHSMVGLKEAKTRY